MSSPLGEPSRRERFDAAVLVHLDAAYNLARWMLRDADAAEDAAQEASLRAFRFFDAIQGPTPKAWYMAIVRNVCLDAMVHARRRAVEDSFDEEKHGAAMLQAVDGPETPESLALRAADARLLHRCLAALPTEFREVLVLREMEDMSYREISAVVGVPMGTVMSRLSRGRERLARLVRSDDRRKSS